MKIFVKVKPNSKHEKIIKVDETHFVISVTAKPEKGKANSAAVKALAGYFCLGPSKIAIISGLTSREKVFEIEE